MSGSQPPKSPTLEIPRRSTEIEDPGAHELDSDEEPEVFSDAQEEKAPSPSRPIPTTRVEKVDDKPAHGEKPGTKALRIRTQDAEPDQTAVIPETADGKHYPYGDEPPQSPAIVIDKVDPDSPSHGEIPGTRAYTRRSMDAVPDRIRRASESRSRSPGPEGPARERVPTPIPRTVVTRVDSEPSHGEVPGTAAYEKRTQDAEPDVIEKTPDSPSDSYFTNVVPPNPGRGTSPIAADGGFGPMSHERYDQYDSDDNEDESSTQSSHKAQKQNDQKEGLGDDFDDFAEGDQADEFGDFDEGFEEPEQLNLQPKHPAKTAMISQSPFPVLDFSKLKSLDAITEATESHVAAMFPTISQDHSSSPPPPLDSNTTLLIDRSASLWSQLVEPPPLQPPDWVRSRIRRLFLVSLGVPVDLDEILPKSKQKKLILHYTPDSSSSIHADEPANASVSRVKSSELNSSTDSLPASLGTTRALKSSRRKGPAPPPEFDLTAARYLCNTTDAALEGFSDEELDTHVKVLEALEARGKEVLQYWLKRKETAVGEKEAFDGVIENLVRHARKVRK